MPRVMVSSTNNNNTNTPNTTSNNSSSSSSSSDENIVNIYPLSNYYFGSKLPLSFKDETLAERAQRMRTNYAAYGLRTCVEAILVVEMRKHPHLLVCQVKNSFFKLPGGRLRPGESEVEGLKRKLSRKLCADEDGCDTDWEIGECVGMWWRPDFETLMYPYLPTSLRKPKECTKLFLVKLPCSKRFIAPKNLKLLAVPFCEINEKEFTIACTREILELYSQYGM
ncbi:hypothetical protein AQUCO_02000433v1 [Aquilegia coerulea]|uniref:Pre-mRNA cleavage factor Im 25 kDa subunit n=1 Tax=Aquilegia coerulea TaxID=218851 RepID=A0A2G5DHK6_AQUCA|nr:hypothetical protein AQUCO_02000433v1 [Aquilegia coerulea]